MKKNQGVVALTSNAAVYPEIGADTLIGVENVTGGAGRDDLLGGSGNDVFLFAQGSDHNISFNADVAYLVDGNANTLIGNDGDNDLSGGTDIIGIDAAGMGLDADSYAGSALNASAFGLGAAATTADERFLFHGTYLRFDSDGNGANAAVIVTQISGGVLAATDLFIL